MTNSRGKPRPSGRGRIAPSQSDARDESGRAGESHTLSGAKGISWQTRLGSARALAASSEAWRQRPVDLRIRGLVDALNRSGACQTLASCEGHLSPPSDPYVYFICAPEIAETIDRCLHTLRDGGRLHYAWQVTGTFDREHRLGFTIRAHRLSHRHGLPHALIHYVLLRHRIDADLDLMAKGLPKALSSSLHESR